MSIYTTQVRYICEQMSGFTENLNPARCVAASSTKIFDFNKILPIEYHYKFAADLLLHYYTREICEETYGLWKLRLEQKYRDIAPYYSELLRRYDEYKLKDLFTDVEYERTNTGTVTHAKTGTDTKTDSTSQTQTLSGTDVIETDRGRQENSLSLYSDTPQGSVDGMITEEGVKMPDGSTSEVYDTFKVNKYLTNANASKGNRVESDKEETTYGKTNTSNFDSTVENEYGSTLTDTDDKVEKIIGKRGDKSYAQMMGEIRKEIINIELEFIEEFEDCFMQIF